MRQITFLFSILFLSVIVQAQNVGIGTTSPTEKLEVNGNVKADTVKPNAIKLTINAGIDMVLTSDVNGNAIWQPSQSLILPFDKTMAFSGSTPLFRMQNSTTGNGTAMHILANNSSSATAIRGESTTGRAGYFVSASGKALETNGDLKFTGNGEANRAVLTSDANGNATWNSPMVFKAAGFLDEIYPPMGVTKTLTDWLTTPINYNGNSIGGGGFFDNANGKYFVLKDGLYRINVNLRIHASAAGPNDLYILTIIKGANFLITTDNTRLQSGWSTKSISVLVNLLNEDYITFRFYHNSGTTVTIDNAHEVNYFSIEKVL